MSLKKFIKKISRPLVSKLDNQHVRDAWIKKTLETLPENTQLLDAGCGSQRYRNFCKNFQYFGQDFGKYKKDEVQSFTADKTNYEYGKLDFVSDIWNIPCQDESFDAILCTEVLEHIPYPNKTMKEFSRILKPGGQLILTAPSNCFRHMDPYFFYTGFSDQWFKRILEDNSIDIVELIPVGDYYSWMRGALFTHARQGSIVANIFKSVILLPSFLYFVLRKKSPASINTLCEGYHVLARKRPTSTS